MESKIKIYITCFNNNPQFPKNGLFELVQGGAANMKNHFDGVLRDDQGDNISKKNPRFNDAATMYWAWKNTDNDYYGFMQYRRVLSFNEDILPSTVYEKNYLTNDTEAFRDMRLDDPDHMRRVIEQYDIITCNYLQYDPKGYSLYQQFLEVTYEHEDDLRKLIEIIQKKHPEYMAAVREALFVHGQGYFANLFIMKKEFFYNFCEWMFDILLEFDEWKDYSEYNALEQRVPGFLSERLLTIYYTYLRMNTKCKFGELQKCFFETTREFAISPAFKEKKAIPIVLAASKMFLPYTSVAVQSIIDHASLEHCYDIIILHEEITNTAVKNFCAELCKDNISVRFVNVSSYFYKKVLPVRGHFGQQSYYRFALQDIMARYKKVVYLDSDLVVNVDIERLYQVDLCGKVAGAVKDVDTAGLYNGFDPLRKSFAKKKLKFKDPYDYFQAGVMVFDIEKLNEITNFNDLMKVANSKEWDLLDQDILNYVLHGQVHYLDMSWNLPVNWGGIRESKIIALAPGYLQQQYRLARKNPQIVHFFGPEKPWKNPQMDFGDLFWKYANHCSLRRDIKARIEMNKFNYLFDDKKSKAAKEKKNWIREFLSDKDVLRITLRKLIGKGYQFKAKTTIDYFEAMLDDLPLQNCGLKPAFEENTIAIGLMSSAIYLPYMVVTLQSILDYISNEKNYDIIIFHEGIPKDKRTIIQNMVAYISNVSIRFVNVNDSLAHIGGATLPQYAKLIFCRVILSYILYYYEKIIFVDSDMLVRTDLAPCINFVDETKMIAACHEWHYEEYGKTLGLKDCVRKAFNAGFLVINLAMFRKKYTQGQLFHMCNAKNWNYLDQDVMNLLCEDYVEFLDYSWNYRMDLIILQKFHMLECKYSPNYFITEPKIIHYAAVAKPWTLQTLEYEDEFWKTAQRTPFYAHIIIAMSKSKPASTYIPQPLLISATNPARRYINVLLPMGSRRRNFVKKIVRLFK